MTDPAKFTTTKTVKRITTGHGSSELGVEVLLNVWGEVDIPGLQQGDEVVVTIERKSVAAAR